jgi:hypothetical protein
LQVGDLRQQQLHFVGTVPQKQTNFSMREQSR